MTHKQTTRPSGNNASVSTGRVTDDHESHTTTVRPEGIPSERVGRAWDARNEAVAADGRADAGGLRNLKRATLDTPAALETSLPSARPSRKSTRGSGSHLKAATAKGIAVKTQLRSASARARRAQTRH